MISMSKAALKAEALKVDDHAARLNLRLSMDSRGSVRPLLTPQRASDG